jgi:hypothetical protein
VLQAVSLLLGDTPMQNTESVQRVAILVPLVVTVTPASQRNEFLGSDFNPDRVFPQPV